MPDESQQGYDPTELIKAAKTAARQQLTQAPYWLLRMVRGV